MAALQWQTLHRKAVARCNPNERLNVNAVTGTAKHGAQAIKAQGVPEFSQYYFITPPYK